MTDWGDESNRQFCSINESIRRKGILIWITYLGRVQQLTGPIGRIVGDGLCRLQTPVADLYWEYQTLPINQLFILQILTLVHTFFYRNNELPEIYRDYFVINSTVHSHCTRQKSDLHISSVQKSIGQKSIQYVGSVLWNEIPQLLKNPMSKYSFKRKLNAHLLNEQAVFWILCTFYIMLYSFYLILFCIHFCPAALCSCTYFVSFFLVMHLYEL